MESLISEAWRIFFFMSGLMFWAFLILSITLRIMEITRDFWRKFNEWRKN